jgi:hypothetical protein
LYDPGNPVWFTVTLGPLPLYAVERRGLNLSAGSVVFHAHAIKHTFERIPERRLVCWPYLGLAVNSPTHIGQQPKYAGVAFDLCHALSDGGAILVSVLMTPTSRAGVIYPVTSAYPIDQNTLDRRVRIGTTIVL